jgi:glycosyltransferase involved in cell wall biosynthesis
MRVGIIPDETTDMASVKSVFQGLEQTLAQRHEIVRHPPEYFYASSGKQKALYEDFLRKCDIAICRIHEKVLMARDQANPQLPLIGLLMGQMSRGAIEMATCARYLKSTDVLVGNCDGDIEITKKFFTNAQIHKVPFPFDESIFYPIDEQQRRAIRANMRFQPADKILLYSGRITLEKNLHTLLRIFRVLQDWVPDLHLVIAGEPHFTPFSQMGVYPVNPTATLMRLIDDLRIKKEQVHFIGRKSPSQLRDLYAIADLMVNLTLNHDENFGFSQIEAMACGTPVIGTSWGGLKDTIKHGETGYQISTVLTDSGVKINWWEAINRIVSLLEDESKLQRFRENCRASALEFSSQSRYAELLESTVAYCRRLSDGPSEPLKPTDFAREFWFECQPRELSPSLFQRGQKSFEMYKELITPFTGTTENTIPNEEPLSNDELLILAVPVRIEESTIRLDDPIFPLEIVLPEENREVYEAILEVLPKEPAIKLERLQDLIPDHAQPYLKDILKWMFEKGIVLRTKVMDAYIDPEMIGEQMGQPVFSIQPVQFATDVLVIKEPIATESYAAT